MHLLLRLTLASLILFGSFLFFRHFLPNVFGSIRLPYPIFKIRRIRRVNQRVHNTAIRPAVQSTSLMPKSGDEWKTQLYKDLYFKTQNLEFYPEILPAARQTLFSLLHESITIEQDKPRECSILEIETYSAQSLQKFIFAEHERITEEWEAYVERRAGGSRPELFSSREEAAKWIMNQAPVKLVDGAWLGHIHKITTPFALRGVTKDVWQILSEELGDGDLQKNHVYLYADLLNKVGVGLPSSHVADFIDPRHKIGDEMVWRAGTAQLLISLFPHEFLPEILGFNMHYELLTMETLQAARELPEFGISGYYFSLHVSIDNMDSGHTAMALECVIKYLDIVRKQDPVMVPSIWRRIQAGFALSLTSNKRSPLLGRERRIANMLQAKANASHQIHCSSRVKIGGQTLAQWLSPNNWTQSDECQRDFLRALSNAKPWVIKGKSSKSLLVRELAWNGRMFGAFTNKEFDDLQAWIDNLDSDESNYESRYWGYATRSELDRIASASNPFVQDITTHHPVYLQQPLLHNDASISHSIVYDRNRPFEVSPINIDDASLEAVLLIWFAHPCLLENLINTPYRTATPFASHILRVLRAELGFLEEGYGVEGKDEQHRLQEGHSLVSLGLEMNQRLGRPPPTNLEDVYGADVTRTNPAATFSKALLSFALRPVQNKTLLVGLAFAFLDLEAAVSEHYDLLSLVSRQALKRIVSRKCAALQCCLEVLGENRQERREVLRYYVFGKKRIANVISSASS
jgi:hypothetical protein